MILTPEDRKEIADKVINFEKIISLIEHAVLAKLAKTTNDEMVEMIQKIELDTTLDLVHPQDCHTHLRPYSAGKIFLQLSLVYKAREQEAVKEANLRGRKEVLNALSPYWQQLLKEGESHE
jgi:hypothetical protein